MCLAEGFSITAYILHLSAMGAKSGHCLNFASITEGFSLSSKILTTCRPRMHYILTCKTCQSLWRKNCWTSSAKPCGSRAGHGGYGRHAQTMQGAGCPLAEGTGV